MLIVAVGPAKTTVSVPTNPIQSLWLGAIRETVMNRETNTCKDFAVKV